MNGNKIMINLQQILEVLFIPWYYWCNRRNSKSFEGTWCCSERLSE